MENTLFQLSTCSTCARIIKETRPGKGIRNQDIKNESITAEQLDEMAKLAGGYEPLFSRKAMKFRSLGLKDKKLTEKDYRKLILEEYTFLKRPVFVIDGEIFIGYKNATIAAVKEKLDR